jgi:hypothetical protein
MTSITWTGPVCERCARPYLDTHLDCLTTPPAEIVVAAEAGLTVHEVTIITRTYKDGQESMGTEHAEYRSHATDPQAAAGEIAVEAGKQLGKDRFRRVSTDT